jgi:hypothetical protein
MIDVEERYLNARADLYHARINLEEAEREFLKPGASPQWERLRDARRADVEKAEALLAHLAAQREAAFGGV